MLRRSVESVRAAGRGLRAAPARSWSVKGCRRGITLFELVLVLALLVLLAAIAYPSLEDMYVYFRVSAGADKVRAAWATARAQAVNEGRPYRFMIVPGMGNFRVAPDRPDFWAGVDGAAGDVGSPLDGEFLVMEDALPKGVRFLVGSNLALAGLDAGGETFYPPGEVDPTLWAEPVVFLPDGTTRADVELILHARGTRPLVLRLRALTGAVSVRPLTGEMVEP